MGYTAIISSQGLDYAKAFPVIVVIPQLSTRHKIVTPESWTKGVWWNMKKNMDWREYEGESNPLVPYGIVTLLQHIRENTKASEESPAVLARGKPMNPAGRADEGRARKPPTPFQGVGRRPVKH
jgi:hypothetical protein